MKHTLCLTTLLALLTTSLPAAETATAWYSGTVLNEAESYELFLFDMSDNGESFVGTMNTRRGFELSLFYQRSAGLLSVPVPQGAPTDSNYDYVFNGVSADGSEAVGQLLLSTSIYRFAVDYRVGVGISIYAPPPAGTPTYTGNLLDIAGDGTVVALIQDTTVEETRLLPIMYPPGADPELIPRFFAGASGGDLIRVRMIPSALAANGQWVTGSYFDGEVNFPVIAERTQNEEERYAIEVLTMPRDFGGGIATGVSNDGTVRTGFVHEPGDVTRVQTCMWFEDGGLRVLTLGDGGWYSAPESISADGEVVTGSASPVSAAEVNHAFIHIRGRGTFFLDDWLFEEFGLDTSGYQLESAIVNDAATMIGGIARPTGDTGKPQFYLITFDSPIRGGIPIFDSSVAYDGEWYFSEWLGWYNTTTYPYFYHLGLNWLYHSSGGEDGAWTFHPVAGWCWLDRGAYPWVYNIPPSGQPEYLFHLRDTAWFYSDVRGWFLALQ